jgi:hypothetical protein
LKNERITITDSFDHTLVNDFQEDDLNKTAKKESSIESELNNELLVIEIGSDYFKDAKNNLYGPEGHYALFTSTELKMIDKATKMNTCVLLTERESKNMVNKVIPKLINEGFKKPDKWK